MQVSVETTSELNRKMTVQVPEEKIQEKVVSRLKSLARDAKLDGFRPGKVPQSIIKQRFGGRVREEVVAELIQSSFFEALQEKNLRPAGGPEIIPQETAEGKGLEYVANFEVYPEFKLTPVEDLKIRHPVSQVTEADVDWMIEKLREQKKVWKAVERPAAQDDRVIISFEGKTDGECFTNGKVENFAVVLGSNQMVAGFEDKLSGAAAGSHLNFQIDFPADYANEKLAGKTAEFDIDVQKVEEAELPEVDAEFIKQHGIEEGDVEAFRKDVKANMEREMERAIRERMKTDVMKALYENNPLTLPQTLVEQEIERMMAPYKEAAKKHPEMLDTLSRDKFEESARKRVALGLMLGDIIKQNNISPDKERIKATIFGIAQGYEKPDEVMNWYYSNSDQLRQVEHMVLEDQVVDWVLARVQKSDEEIGFKELMNPDQDQQ